MHALIGLVMLDLNRKHRLDMLMYAWSVAVRQSLNDRMRAEQFHDNMQELLLGREFEDEETRLYYVENELLYYTPQFLFNQRHLFQHDQWRKELYHRCLKAVLVKFHFIY